MHLSWPKKNLLLQSAEYHRVFFFTCYKIVVMDFSITVNTRLHFNKEIYVVQVISLPQFHYFSERVYEVRTPCPTQW